MAFFVNGGHSLFCWQHVQLQAYVDSVAQRPANAWFISAESAWKLAFILNISYAVNWPEITSSLSVSWQYHHYTHADSSANINKREPLPDTHQGKAGEH